MKRASIAGALGAAVLTAAVSSAAASVPSVQTAAAPDSRSTAAARADCPRHALPLRPESIARAADQARIEAPALYPNAGPPVVELAWRGKLRLSVWAGTPIPCGDLARRRTVVVDLLFPKLLPSQSLSKAVVLVSRFPRGYRVWSVAH